MSYESLTIVGKQCNHRPDELRVIGDVVYNKVPGNSYMPNNLYVTGSLKCLNKVMRCEYDIIIRGTLTLPEGTMVQSNENVYINVLDGHGGTIKAKNIYIKKMLGHHVHLDGQVHLT